MLRLTANTNVGVDHRLGQATLKVLKTSENSLSFQLVAKPAG